MLPSGQTMVGETRLWSLRALKHIAIPDGVETIGD